MNLRLAEGPDVAALPLGADQIARCRVDFGAKNDDCEMWTDCEQLAARFWSFSDGPDRETAWHHLLLSVGNFKRQTPIRRTHLPASLREVPAARASFDLPDGRRIERDNPNSWPALCSTSGVGAATATTLLSALWPGRHVIIDQVAWSVTVALRATEGRTTRRIPAEATTPLPDISWDDYCLYLPVVCATAREMECEPVDVERTLYVLGLKRRGDGDSWLSFGEGIKVA
ncbi:MAG: hypothetical protein M3066_10135 [Actinomycetota bacterium]|nr:hypothetical protein [Actinomycetota bacterium]